MKAIQLKYVVLTGLLVLGLATHSSAAPKAEVAEAAAVMSDLQSLVVQAKANESKVALGGDTDSIAEFYKQSAAVDDAVTAGNEAVAVMNLAMANEDDEAFEAGKADLAEALEQARNALLGIFPVTVATAEPGDDGEKDYDPPNIYEVPWKSQGIRAYYESLFGTFNDARSFGGERGFGDRQATPE